MAAILEKLLISILKEGYPKEDGLYLTYYKGLWHIANFATNLSKVSDDFAGNKKAGFYQLDPRAGHYIIDAEYYLKLPINLDAREE